MSKQAMEKMFRKFSAKHSLWDVYTDFLKLAAISISNSCDILHSNEREKDYMSTIKKYSPEDAVLFWQILGELAVTIQSKHDDVLGEMFMVLELGSKLNGQFFTPYDICRASAKMILGDVDKLIKKQNYITIDEPACGGAAMIIAAAEVIKEKGFNPQQTMLVNCTDLDIKAVHMAYIQLSLYGIPAVIHHGNTLTLEEFSTWYTPMYVVGGWNFRSRIIG